MYRSLVNYLKTISSGKYMSEYIMGKTTERNYDLTKVAMYYDSILKCYKLINLW